MNEDRVPYLQLVTTIKEKCRRCYTCVRECPAKAIQILDGQASVIQTRCIGCGNCVTVCSQNAKQVLSGIEETEELLAGDAPVAAIVAPSYPAEFTECSASGLVGALRDLGFSGVHEVSFGADLVAEEYVRLLGEHDGRHIATTCPAVVSYVRKYHPDILDRLAPIVSPMLAIARVLHKKYGPELRIVFIGPCIAKKGEARYEQFEGEVHAALTYVELRALLAARGVGLLGREESRQDFDPPHGGLGALFPITRGMLQAANLDEDLLSGDIVTADGRQNLVDAITDFEHGQTEARLLDILCCEGCIMGAGFSTEAPVFKRRSAVSAVTRARQAGFDQAAWEADVAEYADVDLSRTFAPFDQRFDDMPTDAQLQEILARMNKYGPEDELDCGACGYDSCRHHAVAIWQGLAEVEMCLPYSVEELRKTVDELQQSNLSLKTTKEALVKSEKLASMGQLAAGIAHEVNNPLGILLLHANLLLEDCEEDPEISADVSLIVDQANRCKKIISGLLNFARQSRVVRQPTDLTNLVGEVMRTLPFAEGVSVEVIDHLDDPTAELDGDQIVQVLTNLLTNAQHAMPDGGTITVTLDGTDENVIVTVQDEGMGIPDENLDKLFSPFFTTKQVGKGTGLGLAVTHGIVKMHRGQITVESNADPAAGPTGTTFSISLPRYEAETDVPASLQEITGELMMNADPAARESLMDPQQATLKVVMVDDEEALCLGVRRIIQKYRVHVPDVLVDADYEFRYFTTGEEYLAWLDDGGEVDLLLLDLKLPGVGGMDVLDAMSSQGREVLTIMITAYATFETAVKATKLGAYDFLAKPFTPEELRYALRKATSQLILSKQARKLAEEKREIRFNFISVLAHELKAPLNAVEGYLNILRTTEADQNLQMVERSIVRVDGMKKLIMDLLDLTRIESGQRERVVKRLDLRGLARASMELFAVDAERRGITVELEDGEDIELLADPGEVEIVFNNLISNAVKYNRDGGHVTIKLNRKADAVTVTVTDTGIGLTSDEAAKLFNEFTRIKNEQTVKILGSGLGLSTVRKIANMYDGEARVTSEPGVGSTFAVTLRDAPPAGSAPAPEPATEPAAAAAPQL